MQPKPRSDKGKRRKVVIEDVLEAIGKVQPKIHGKTPTRALLYRLCIEAGLLTRSQIAPNTFSRLVREFELLKPDRDSTNKHRLAFAKAHANEMWQADTLYGPFVSCNGTPVQTRLIAFLDDASRLLSRPVLPGGKCGHAHRIIPRGVLQTRRATRALCGQRLHLLVQGNPPNLCPRRLPVAPYASQGRSGQGQG
jgi:hypothetical protein